MDHRYIADLEHLHANPHRLDLAWQYGIDANVLNDDIRCTEVKNFIRFLVLPYAQTKRNRIETDKSSG
jgi:hypothetical protein